VIFLMPLAPVRSTAAFTTAKIAPWTAAATSTSLVLYSDEVASGACLEFLRLVTGPTRLAHTAQHTHNGEL
jgi:hypothetical protein